MPENPPLGPRPTDDTIKPADRPAAIADPSCGLPNRSGTPNSGVRYLLARKLAVAAWASSTALPTPCWAARSPSKCFRRCTRPVPAFLAAFEQVCKAAGCAAAACAAVRQRCESRVAR